MRFLKNPTEREMDVLMTCGEQETIALMALALHALKVPAVSRTGWQSEILTEGIHTKSRIREVKGGDIRKQLKLVMWLWLRAFKVSATRVM